MTQHTPGPWYAGEDGAIWDSLVEDFVPFGTNLIAATANIGHLPTFKANARLIAAAPELLDALRVAETLIAADIVRDDAGCLDKIRAAIAKATGGAT